MEGSRLQEHAALLVADDRARLIAVPQSLYDLHIFIGQPISLAMADMMVAAEIGGGALQPGRHYIPTCPSPAQLIQRGELPGQIERFGITDGKGADQADMLRHHRSEERRVGNGCDSTCRTRWWPS